MMFKKHFVEMIGFPSNYLVAAGLAVFDGVLGLEMVLPKAEMPSFPVTLVMVDPPTERRDGRGVVVPDPPRRRCGIRDGVVSSVWREGDAWEGCLAEDEAADLPVLSRESADPWCDGGLDPPRLAGRELGFDPPGVRTTRLGVYDGLRGVYRPRLLSLSLSESGVDAESDDRDGRDMATERAERSRTWSFTCGQWIN